MKYFAFNIIHTPNQLISSLSTSWEEAILLALNKGVLKISFNPKFAIFLGKYNFFFIFKLLDPFWRRNISSTLKVKAYPWLVRY